MTARDAQANRFPELEAELDLLRSDGKGEALDLSIRFALVPGFDREGWEAIEPLVIRSEDERDLVVELQDSGILSGDSLALPGFGHATRKEVTLRWILEAVLLITQAAGRIRSVDDPRAAPTVLTLIEVSELAAGLDLPERCRLFHQSCRSLLGLRDQEILEAMAGAASKLGRGKTAGALIAMALFNTLIDAKQEEALERRDALLDELRELAAAHPEDGAVQEALARGWSTS